MRKRILERTPHRISDRAQWTTDLRAQVRSTVVRMAMHQDELVISAATVQQLISEQFPEWSREVVEQVKTQGTMNAIYRIGTARTARFPLRNSDPGRVAAKLRREASAMREILAVCPVPAPYRSPWVGRVVIFRCHGQFSRGCPAKSRRRMGLLALDSSPEMSSTSLVHVARLLHGASFRRLWARWAAARLGYVDGNVFPRK